MSFTPDSPGSGGNDSATLTNARAAHGESNHFRRWVRSYAQSGNSLAYRHSTSASEKQNERDSGPGPSPYLFTASARRFL
jgi:hypothetical protein